MKHLWLFLFFAGLIWGCGGDKSSSDEDIVNIWFLDSIEINDHPLDDTQGYFEVRSGKSVKGYLEYKQPLTSDGPMVPRKLDFVGSLKTKGSSITFFLRSSEAIGEVVISDLLLEGEAITTTYKTENQGTTLEITSKQGDISVVHRYIGIGGKWNIDEFSKDGSKENNPSGFLEMDQNFTYLRELRINDGDLNQSEGRYEIERKEDGSYSMFYQQKSPKAEWDCSFDLSIEELTRTCKVTDSVSTISVVEKLSR